MPCAEEKGITMDQLGKQADDANGTLAALAGVTVLEFGAWIAAPFAAKILGDLGAQVTKIEHEDAGDPSRRWGPFPPGRDGDIEVSGLFSYLNTNKRSEIIAPGDPVEEVVRGRPAAPDIIIIDEHFLGPDPKETVRLVRAAAPESVVVAVTPFGTDGPYAGFRGFDLITSAAGGTSYGVGERNRAPLPLPFSQSDKQTAIIAATAALMGLIDRRAGGVRSFSDVAAQHVMASLHCGYFLPRYLFSGGVVGLRNGRAGGAQPYPHTVMPCADGLVTLAAPKVDQWIRFLTVMGSPDWSKEPRYRNRRAMQWEYKEEVDALVSPWFLDKTKEELLDVFLANRIPFAPLLTGRDLVHNRHLRERGAIREIEFPGGGSFHAPTLPFRFSRTPASRTDRAPRLGEHGRVIAAGTDDGASLPPSSGGPAPTLTESERRHGPLHGVRVLDLGTAWAGGVAGRILGDFGADVIKVESWRHMDGSRMGKPIVVDDEAGGDEGDWPDLQPGFHVHGRSKRSVALNLRSEQGIDLLLRLVEQADVLIHNFTPRVARSLGLDWQRLTAVNSRLVIVGQSVAGDGGPLSDYTGYASTVASLAGFANAVGYEGEEPIGSIEGLYTDIISATSTVLGVLAGLLERGRSQLGQYVDISQWEALMTLAPEPLLEYSITGADRASEGFAHALLCPHSNYPCRFDTDDETQNGAYVAIAVATDMEWQGLLSALSEHGEPAAGAATWGLAERRANRDIIDRWISSWTSTMDADRAQAQLQGSGVAAFRVGNIADVFVDPQLMHRGAFITLEHPLVGLEPMPGLPWDYADEPIEVTRRAPLLGEHTQEVLTELLGITPARYEELVALGAIETRPAGEAG